MPSPYDRNFGPTEEELRRAREPSFRMSSAGRRTPIHGPPAPGVPLKERVLGLGEAGATVATMLGSMVPAGLAAIATLPFEGVEGAAKRSQDVSDALTYLPRSEAGSGVLEALAGPLEAVSAPTMAAADAVRSRTGSPLLATATELALDPFNLLAAPAVPAAARGVKRAAKAAGRELGPKAAEMAEGYMRRAGLMPEITTYQGSPYVFAPEEGAPLGRLRAEKIGTGEGGAMFGHGHYLAEKPEVATRYAQDLSNRDISNQNRLTPHANAQRLARLAGDDKYAADDIRFVLETNPDHPQKRLLQETLRFLESGEYKKPLAMQGNLYTVDLPDPVVDKMLDWDAPLSEQPESVQKMLRDLAKRDAKEYGEGGGLDYYAKDPDSYSGESLYKYLSEQEGGQKQASEFLQSQGVPGVRYFDEFSRDKGEGTRNFVVFPGEEKNLTILQRNEQRLPQTDTPAFKEFTGGAPLIKADQASKAEFQTGKPVVIEGFSGTRRDFSEIDPALSSSGYFLSSKPVVADEYAGVYPEGMGGGSFPTGGNIQRSFVRMDNPLFVNARGASFNRIDTRGIPGFGLPMSNTDMLNHWAKQQGYDGVIYKDLRDSLSRPGGQNAPASNVYVSFKPNYVKSAIGNRGTFDVQSRDMTKAQGGAVEGNMGYSQTADMIAAKLMDQGVGRQQALQMALRMADAHMKAGGAVLMAGGGSLRRGLKRAAEATREQQAKRAVEAAKKAEAARAARTETEKSVVEKFGQKQEQEAARAAKVQQASQSTEPPKPVRAAPKKGRAAAVPPDVYRQMAKTQGDDAVIRAAERGAHLRPAPGGGYVGAPRTVTSPQGLGAMRRAIDKDFADSVEAVRLADPERLGTWYDRAKAGISQSAEPYQLDRTLDQHAVYSAGVSPESELGFALKHLNSRVAGLPEQAFRGPGMQTLDTAVAQDRPAKLGFKVGEYREKNDPRVPNTGLFGVNDFRRAQGMGYTDPEGQPWRAGVSSTMHPFMDAETALQVSRANRAQVGGRTDWQGPHIQELPWVYGKAQDLYGRGKSGRFGGEDLAGIKSALREANKTAQDYMYKHAASATHEAVPGASLGHVPQVLRMTPEQKLEYGRKGRWDQPAPEARLNPYPQVGAGNRDILYGAAGYRQLPSRDAQGLYRNTLGEVETNPATIARPLMDFPTGGGGGLMAPQSRKVAETLEQFRAFMDAQEAGAYNLPNTMKAVKNKTSMVLDTRGRLKDKDDPSAGALPTSQQLAAMDNVLAGTGFGVSATNRGAVVFPYDPTINPKEAQKVLRQKRGALTSIFPSDPQMSMTTTGYVPGIGKRGEFGPEATAPFSGEATSDLLRAFADLEPKVSLNISESEAVRQAIRDKALRDSLMGGARRDIQESRRFFSEADWPRAVEMIRQGMSPAAALAALGYSASSMAGQE